MTVKDFIKELEKCDPDTEIFITVAAHLLPITGIIDYTTEGKGYIIGPLSL
jgi:hypothetical protein